LASPARPPSPGARARETRPGSGSCPWNCIFRSGMNGDVLSGAVAAIGCGHGSRVGPARSDREAKEAEEKFALACRVAAYRSDRHFDRGQPDLVRDCVVSHLPGTARPDGAGGTGGSVRAGPGSRTATDHEPAPGFLCGFGRHVGGGLSRGSAATLRRHCGLGTQAGGTPSAARRAPRSRWAPS